MTLWRKIECSGYGRTDFAVHGDCNCEYVYCDGSCNVPVSGGLTEEEADKIVAMKSQDSVDAFLQSTGRFVWSCGRWLESSESQAQRKRSDWLKSLFPGSAVTLRESGRVELATVRSVSDKYIEVSAGDDPGLVIVLDRVSGEDADPVGKACIDPIEKLRTSKDGNIVASRALRDCWDGKNPFLCDGRPAVLIRYVPRDRVKTYVADITVLFGDNTVQEFKVGEYEWRNQYT